jgi:hypothetical protein
VRARGAARVETEVEEAFGRLRRDAAGEDAVEPGRDRARPLQLPQGSVALAYLVAEAAFEHLRLGVRVRQRQPHQPRLLLDAELVRRRSELPLGRRIVSAAAAEHTDPRDDP